MYKSKLIILFALSALMFTACEKDDVNQPNNRAMEINSKKKAEVANKSSELFDAVVDFIDGIEEDTLTVNHLAEDALMYTESRLNYFLVNDQELPAESKVFHTTYEVPIYSDGGQLYISAAEIQMMNDNLYNEIYTQADNFNFDNGNKDGKFISVVDIEWGTLTSGGFTVDVKYIVNNFYVYPPYYFCIEDLDWFPIEDDGGCNGNTATMGSAQHQINMRANDGSCNQYLNGFCNQGLWSDVKTAGWFYPYEKYSDNSIASGGDRFACVSAAAINQYTDSCIWISNEERPSSNYQLYKVTVGYIYSGNNFIYHRYLYSYGKCLGDDMEHRPMPSPCFDC